MDALLRSCQKVSDGFILDLLPENVGDIPDLVPEDTG
jgi:hypothetical protein